MRLGLAAFTPDGERLVQRLRESRRNDSIVVYDRETMSAREWVKEAFTLCDGLVFVGATGIAVRLIAPHILAKDKDPAVVVIDELGRFVIPLLSGHIGGANRLADDLARFMGAETVITTATDIQGVFAVDTWCIEHDCAIADISLIKHISGRLLRHEKVGFMSDFPVQGSLPAGLVPVPSMTLTREPDGHESVQMADERALSTGILVSLNMAKTPFPITLRIIPKIVILGAGCRKGIRPEVFEAFVHSVLQKIHMPVTALKTLASIDLKENENCFKDFSRNYNLDFVTFSAAELNSVPGAFSSSSFVRHRTGVDNVCERSAMKAGGERLILSKTIKDGMTLALAVSCWTCHFPSE